MMAYRLLPKKNLPLILVFEVYHIYQVDWDANIGCELNAFHEARLCALLLDKYAVAVKFNDVTVEHVPKIFIENITFLFKRRRRSPCENK